MNGSDNINMSHSSSNESSYLDYFMSNSKMKGNTTTNNNNNLTHQSDKHYMMRSNAVIGTDGYMVSRLFILLFYYFYIYFYFY